MYFMLTDMHCLHAVSVCVRFILPKICEITYKGHHQSMMTILCCLLVDKEKVTPQQLGVGMALQFNGCLYSLLGWLWPIYFTAAYGSLHLRLRGLNTTPFC